MNIYSITYTFITIIHNLFWLFVILAFYNKKLAYFNLYIVIPVTYVTHILPFHILERLKEIVKDKDMKEMSNNKPPDDNKPSDNKPPDDNKPAEKSLDDKYKSNIIVRTYIDVKTNVDSYCFANPFSPQGMLIFGAISSAYALKK